VIEAPKGGKEEGEGEGGRKREGKEEGSMMSHSLRQSFVRFLNGTNERV
jgi:hypothetical protein